MEGEEEDEEDRDKFDLIHRKREMVKNYGKKMFRKVSIITRNFAICGNDRERVVRTCVCLVSLSCGSMSYSVDAMPQVILTLLWRCTTYVCVCLSLPLSQGPGEYCHIFHGCLLCVILSSLMLYIL